jgi:histidinol phosphatase-like PHP family hydrolase
MFDLHCHTNISYCGEKELTPEFYAEKIQRIEGLDGVAVTDHGMAIYFPSEIAWSWSFISDSRIFDQFRDAGNTKLERHLADLARFRDRRIAPGIEVEMMHDGRLTFDETFRKRLDIVIGSVHFLDFSIEVGNSPDETFVFWKAHTLRLINSGIDVLGHPFRWISRQLPVAEGTIREIVREAKRAGVAVELNSHYPIEETDVLMLKIAIEEDAVISIGVDAHRPDEIGDFSYHMETILKAGLKLSDLKLLNRRFTQKTDTVSSLLA